jgi:23S rRNA (cytosine1962-C5)-methyltransferase
VSFLSDALAARTPSLDPSHQSALRLFNGFTEGNPTLVADLYATTLLLHNYADPPSLGQATIAEAQGYYLSQLPWLRAVIIKTRNATDEHERNGVLTFGEKPDHWVREHGVRYAIELTMNRDASLYLDTRNLRAWALQHLNGKRVLNTFAYTGSLGVAALAAGASRVVQLDLNRQFLNVAKTSCTLNGFPIHKADFLTGDFWPTVNQLKRKGDLFDCVFLDPPFFAATQNGVVDLAKNTTKLINKVRPLIADGGYLVAINNALFLSGANYLGELEALCADGYLRIEELIPVPEDFTGYPQTRVGGYPVNPAPFNHPTKIAVLRVRRKTPALPLRGRGSPSSAST